MAAEKAPRPEDAAVRMNRSDVEALGKVRSLMPGKNELTRIGEPEVKENAFGRKEVHQRVDTREAIEAMMPAWRADSERAAGLDAKQSKEELVYRDGTKRKVLASVASDAARQTGARPAWHSKATSIYRDGKWWKRQGKEWVEDASGCLTRPLLEGKDRTAPYGVVH